MTGSGSSVAVMRTPAIETTDLTKTFTRGKSTVVAVDRLTLAVEPGELVAFLGPNGAGKSTTLRMLTTLVAPTSGTMRLLGRDVVADPAGARRCFGFVGQGNGAANIQYGRDEVIGQALAHGFGRREARVRADEIIEVLGLTEFARRPVQTLSGGQRRRFDIAIGLVNRPEVMFLDEPSTGLDPANRAHLQTLITDLHARTGSTIVLTTHYLEEADALSRRILVIDHGRLIADDTADNLKAALGDLVVLHLADPASAQAAVHVLQRRHDRVETLENRVHVRTGRGPFVALDLVEAVRAEGYEVRGLEVSRPSLDDVFLDLTGRSLRESAPSADPTLDPTLEPGTTMSEEAVA